MDPFELVFVVVSTFCITFTLTILLRLWLDRR